LGNAANSPGQFLTGAQKGKGVWRLMRQYSIFRKSNCWLTIIALVLLFCTATLPVGAVAATERPDHITLTWTDAPQTTQTIRWRTDSDTATGWLRLSQATLRQTAEYRQIEAQTRAWQTNTGVVNLHTVNLTGLMPDSIYSYQVGGGENWSRPQQFRTAPVGPAPFKFLIMGDSQSLDYGVWRTTLHKAATDHPDAAFFVAMGDLVDVGQDYDEWEAWFAAGAGILETLPVMPLVGNHECYTPERRFSRPEFFTAQFALPRSGPPELAGQVYSFDYGDVHLVMLDSQAGEQARLIPDLLVQQRQWLEADLAATDKRWKLVFMHRPIYGNKPDGIQENLRQAFERLFEQYHVDLVFTAHDHVYALSGPFSAGAVALPPDRGVRYVATGRTGTKTYRTVEAKSWNSVFINPIERPMFLTVTVSGDTLRIGAFDQTGELMDSWQMDKTK
jgi:acid phosphatase type 7